MVKVGNAGSAQVSNTLPGGIYLPPPPPPSRAKSNPLTRDEKKARDECIASEKDAYYSYLSDVKDVITDAEVTKDTRLCSLFVPHKTKDKEMRNRVFPTKPHLSTQFVVNEGAGLKIPEIAEDDAGAKDMINTNGLTMFMCFNKLDYAPCICLQLQLRDTAKQLEPLATASIEFPFTGEIAMLEDSYIQTSYNEGSYLIIEQRFMTGGAYSSGGLGKLLELRDQLSEPDKALLDYFAHFHLAPAYESVWLKSVQQPTRENKKAGGPITATIDPLLKETLTHIPRTQYSEGHFIPQSFNRSNKPYAGWETADRSNLLCQAGRMVPPRVLIANQPPAPMMPLWCGYTFSDMREARMLLGVGVHSEFLEDSLTLKKLCKIRHLLRLYSSDEFVVACIQFNEYKLVNAEDGTRMRLVEGTRIKLTWQSLQSEQVQEAEGVVARPSLHLPLTDLAIILTNRDNASFQAGSQDDKDTSKSKGAAKAWKDIRNWPDENKEKWMSKKPYHVTLEIQPNMSVYRNQMFTLNYLTSGACQQWEPLLLNQQPSPSEKSDPLMSIEVPVGDDEKKKWQEKVDEVYDWMLKFKFPGGESWNEEQREVIEKLRCTHGKLVLVAGMAGTGKTSVLEIIAIGFYVLGAHVLWDAPANTNVEDFVARLESFVEVYNREHKTKVDFLRIATRASERTLQQMSDKEHTSAPMPEDINHGDEYGWLENKLADLKGKCEGSRDRHLQSRVLDLATRKDGPGFEYLFYYNADEDDDDIDAYIEATGVVGKEAMGDWEGLANFERDIGISNTKAAEDDDAGIGKPPTFEEAMQLSTSFPPFQSDQSELSKPWSFRCTEGQDGKNGVGYYVNQSTEEVTLKDPRLDSIEYDAWSELKHFITRARDQSTWDWVDENGHEDVEAKMHFRKVYSMCCKQVLAHCRFVCTTSATANSKLMRTNWASAKHGADAAKAVIILKEEAAKDVEANFWGSIVHGNWRAKVELVVACGDQRQLSPVVTGGEGQRQLNPARVQLATSAFTRFIQEGVDHVELVQQNRMHEDLAAFPNENCYDGKLVSADRCKKSIEHDMGDIKKRALNPIFQKMGISKDKLKCWVDDQMRFFVFEVDGVCRINPTTRSKVNFEQIQFAMDYVLEKQIAFYGKQTSKKCMWITGYSEQCDCMRAMFHTYQKDNKLLPQSMPKIHTIDSAQGAEAEWVLFFTTIDNFKSDKIGFLKSKNRINVAFTRAKQLFWTITGSLRSKSTTFTHNDDDNNEPYLLVKYVYDIRKTAENYHKFVNGTAYPQDKLPFHLIGGDKALEKYEVKGYTTKGTDAVAQPNDGGDTVAWAADNMNPANANASASDKWVADASGVREDAIDKEW